MQRPQYCVCSCVCVCGLRRRGRVADILRARWGRRVCLAARTMLVNTPEMMAHLCTLVYAESGPVSSSRTPTNRVLCWRNWCTMAL